MVVGCHEDAEHRAPRGRVHALRARQLLQPPLLCTRRRAGAAALLRARLCWRRGGGLPVLPPQALAAGVQDVRPRQLQQRDGVHVAAVHELEHIRRHARRLATAVLDLVVFHFDHEVQHQPCALTQRAIGTQLARLVVHAEHKRLEAARVLVPQAQADRVQHADDECNVAVAEATAQVLQQAVDDLAACTQGAAMLFAGVMG